MSQDKIRVGFIGVGYWGPNHIRNFSNLRHKAVEVVVAADPNPDARWKVATQYPWVKTIESADAVLEDPSIDAVVISTPPKSHFPIAYKALLQGKHVLLEKPFTTTLEDAHTLVACAEDMKKMLMVGHTFEYTSVVEYLEGALQRDNFGDALHVRSLRTNLGLYHHGTDVLWDLAPHDISILTRLFGDPSAVQCLGQCNIQSDKCDVAHLFLEWPNWIKATVVVSWLDPCKQREMIFAGTNAMIKWDDCTLEKIEFHNKSAVLLDSGYDYKRGESFKVEFEDMGEPLFLEAMDFINAIRTGETPRASAKSGLRVVRVLEAATQSMRNAGKRILLPRGN